MKSSKIIDDLINKENTHITDLQEYEDQKNKTNRINQELKKAKIGILGNFMSITKQLPNIIRSNEHIRAISYGFEEGRLKLMVACDKRLLVIERNSDRILSQEIDYSDIEKFHYDNNTISPAIHFETPVKEFLLKAINKSAAKRFRLYINLRRLTRMTQV